MFDPKKLFQQRNVPAEMVPNVSSSVSSVNSVNPANPVNSVNPANPVNSTEGLVPVVEWNQGMDINSFPVRKVSFGEKEGRSPINLFKGIRGFTRRISIPCKDEVIASKMHYEPGIGKFYCFGGSCCLAGLPKVRYLIPIIVYDTNKNGEVVSPKYVVEYLALSESIYDQFISQDKVSSLEGLDFLVVCTDENFQRNSFTPGCVPGQAVWKNSKDFVGVVEKVKEMARFIPVSYARVIKGEEHYTAVKSQYQSTQKGDKVPF